MQNLRSYPSIICGVALAACSSPQPIVTAPTQVPVAPPADYVERTPTGSIFQANMRAEDLFAVEKRARSIGDKLKVDIVVQTKGSAATAKDTSRANSVETKGPGTASKGAVLEPILNLNLKGNGSDSYQGKGSSEANDNFDGQVPVMVINVLPNGYLQVAGERTLGVNGDASVLRFSGYVNPNDIRRGNSISSSEVLNAQIEYTNDGELGEAARRSWIQRLLAKRLAIW